MDTFDPALVNKACDRIARALAKRGPTTRRTLQLSTGSRDIKADTFAAALTTMLDEGSVTFDGEQFSPVAESEAFIRRTKPAREPAPEWDRSGRKWRVA